MVVKASMLGGLFAALALGACNPELPVRATAAGAAPIVTITSSEISIDGKVVGSSRQIARDTSQERKVVALYETLQATRIRRAAINLLVIRVEDSVVTKVIDRVLNSAQAAGYHYILAYRQGDGWAVVEPPATTAFPGAPTARDEPWPRLSLLIDQYGFWLGTSVVSEFHQIKKSGTDHDFAALTSGLAERKANALFQDRTDIEIAAEGNIDFATFRRVVSTAVQQGFPNWMMHHPSELSAGPML